LRATILSLVEHSVAGYTHEELEPILKLRVHDTLLFLVKTGQLRRELFLDTYVYLSTQKARAAQQLAERQKLVPAPAEQSVPEVPGQLSAAVLIDLLLDVIRHPGHDAKAVCWQLASQGHWITPEQVENVFRHYDLKKPYAPARSARGPEIRGQIPPRTSAPAGAGARGGFRCRA
jgi:hypothetical protein